jgi:hypothetical protein
VRRRVLILSLAVAALAGSSFAFASTLNGVTAAKLTVYAAASTVPTSVCSSTSTKDTWVDSAHKNTQHATTANLDVTSGSKPTYALVQFTPCAPANAAVVSASLQLYLRTAPGSTRTYGVFPITSSWVETDSWNSQPTVGAQSASATTGASGSTTSWTVTADTQGFVNGGANNGWEIQDNGAGATTTGSYDSREGTNAPALSIVYYP